MGFELLIKYLRSVPVRGRSVLKEAEGQYKVYMPTYFNDLWSYIYESGKSFDVIVIFPKISNSDKPRILDHISELALPKRRLTKENDKYKMYLPRQYSDVWKFLHEKKIEIDLVVLLP